MQILLYASFLLFTSLLLYGAVLMDHPQTTVRKCIENLMITGYRATVAACKAGSCLTRVQIRSIHPRYANPADYKRFYDRNVLASQLI